MGEEPQVKTIRIKFIDGSFRIIKDITEYVSGKSFFFVAKTGINGDIETFAYKREDIEYINRKNSVGKYRIVKLKNRN